MRATQGTIARQRTKRVICMQERNESSHVEVAPDEFWDGTTEAAAVYVSAKTTQRIEEMSNSQ